MTDHVNFVVGSIIFVLVKPNSAKHTPYCIGQSASAFTQVLNYFPLDGHKMFKIFFLKSRVNEIMVVENNNKPGKQFLIVFNSAERK